MTCEIWLEITDASDTGGDDELRIAWRWQVRSRSGSAEFAFASPLTEHTQALLRSYVRDFCSWRPRQRDWALTAERTLLQLGRSLGNALVDPQYQMLTLCELLEREGVSALHVAVASDQPRVRELPWELMILPDSAYVLAAAAAAFVRAPAGSRPFEAPVRELALHAEQPLRYLRIGAGLPAQPSSVVSNAWKQLRWGGALHYRFAADFEAIDAAATYQIVHWSPSSADSSCDVIERAGALGAELLILEAGLAGPDLHELAHAALLAGIDNVVVLTEPTVNAWPSAWSDHLLDCLRSGLHLRHALVETRKRMQRQLLDARQAEVEQLHAPQQWHALRHYSRCDVRFFAAELPLVALESTEAHAALRGSMFGFDAQRLPGQAPDLGDPAVLALHDALRPGRTLLAFAAHGGGLTHALHRLAMFARANLDVERAYYWDFASEPFTAADMLEMIAGASGQTDRDQVSEAGVLEALAERRELFVLDNLDALPSGSAELLAFVARLSAAGGLCVVGSHAKLASEAYGSAFQRIELSPLTEAESVALLQAISPTALGFGPSLSSMLESLRGNPLLISRVLPHCKAEDLPELEDFQGSVERFHAQRWEQLDTPWRRLLSAWLPLHGLYLQTLMIAVDRPGGERSEAGRKLWALLEAPDDVSCSEAIAKLQAAGFVVQSGAGACIDRSALEFLRSRATTEPRPELEAPLAQLLCEGVLRLLERRNHALGDSLAGHLLQNRGLIRAQIELLLRAREYVLSTRTFLNMHALLSRAQLTREASAWARALLEAAGPALCNHEDGVAGAAWLSMAVRADMDPLDGMLQAGVQRWTELLTRGESSGDDSRRALVPLAVAFLEKIYDQTNDFAAYRAVARVACDHHRASDNHAALIPQLRALAAAEHALGNFDERDRIEEELVNGSSSAEGGQLRQQTLAQLAGTRLRRGDDRGAEALIELLEREGPDAAPNWLAQSLRGELSLARARPELAAEYFCRLWHAAVSGKRGIDIDAVAHRLRQLEQRLGSERFAALYTDHAGSSPTPDALGLMVAHRPARASALGVASA